MSKRLSNVSSICVSPVHICVYLNILTPVFISLYPELPYICVYPDNLYIFVYITVLSYKQNNFGCFLKHLKFWIFSKTHKTVLFGKKCNIARDICTSLTIFLYLFISGYKAKCLQLFQQEGRWDRAGCFAYPKPYELKKNGWQVFHGFFIFHSKTFLRKCMKFFFTNAWCLGKN